MKTNYTQRYVKRKYYFYHDWSTHADLRGGRSKSLYARKLLRRWVKNRQRKAENIIAPLKIEE